jgi:hypothetical protein
MLNRAYAHSFQTRLSAREHNGKRNPEQGSWHPSEHDEEYSNATNGTME